MLVAIVTDSGQPPVELIYFLLGAGFESTLSYESPAEENSPSRPDGDCYVAHTIARTPDELTWICKLPCDRASIMLADAHVGLRSTSVRLGYGRVFTYPSQMRELGDTIRQIEPNIRKAQAQFLTGCYEIGDVRFDVMARSLQNGQVTIGLTFSETKVLAVMACQAGRVITRLWLQSLFGSNTSHESTRRVDVMVSGLRSKLKSAGSSATIVSVRNQGYRISGECVAIDPPG